MKVRGQAERGSALVLSIVISFIVISIAGTYLVLSLVNQNNVFRTSAATQALYTAEAAAATYIHMLNSPGAPSTPSTTGGELGAGSFVVNPVAYGSDNVDNDGNGVKDGADPFEQRFIRLDVEGRSMGQIRHLRVVITKDPGGVFWNAIFAGNKSGSDDYTMTFSSDVAGKFKDRVNGDIYAGGKLAHLNHAELMDVKGTTGSEQVMYASDDIDALTAASGQKPAPTYVHGSQPNLDIASMNYDLKAAAAAAGDTSSPYWDPNFVNVTDRIAKNGTDGYVMNTKNTGTGVARQINDPNDPAHIFRLDPKDNGKDERVKTYSKMSTEKPDYFLEDPTRPHAQGSAGGNWLGSDDGMRINVTPNNNNKVYYIDGNLWVSNSPTWTFHFQNNTGSDMKMTFIVKGNVYLTDNLLYDRNMTNDALAIIAIGDDAFVNHEPADYMPGGAHFDSSVMGSLSGADQLAKAQELARDYNKVHGSGNIFFGDPGSGTTERFEAYMYAENNFYDHNMGASGTNETNIFGNMTAGNHVQIQRQTDPKTYKPMKVQFDQRVRLGQVTLPGLPGNPSTSGTSWLVASWNIDPTDRTAGF